MCLTPTITILSTLSSLEGVGRSSKPYLLTSWLTRGEKEKGEKRRKRRIGWMEEEEEKGRCWRRMGEEEEEGGRGAAA